MKHSNDRLIEMLIIVIVSTFVGILGGGAFIYSLNYKSEKSNSISSISEIDEMYETIVEDYYDDIDKEKVIEGAISGMLSVLDEHTAYMNQDTTSSFNKKMNGEYYGIGIEALTLEEEGILVVSVMADSPAQRSGIKENDVIIELNGESLKDKKASYFTSIVEKTSEEIKLTIKRDEKEMNISVLPEKIIIESVSIDKFSMNNKRIGYIKISIFAANTASQFATKLKELEEGGIDSLIIDVRNNSGGYLSAASTMLEMFMEKGSILYKTESKDVVAVKKDSTDEHREYPIAVLINNSSASASEILAASLKDNLNATLIGNTTYGKGTVQETINVLDGSKAKITTKKWLTPNGDWINETGIEPTIRVTLKDKYYENPIKDNDNQLTTAIKVMSE
jgi:carboxyl-terminal processing protease